jgi:hypothetical protein
MKRATAKLRELRSTRRIIENSDSYLAVFDDCFEGRPTPIRCRAAETSLVVDCYGRVFPCVPVSGVDRPIGRANGRTRAAFWKSGEYAAARRSYANCRACYWNCHTEMNLLWQAGAAR